MPEQQATVTVIKDVAERAWSSLRSPEYYRALTSAPSIMSMNTQDDSGGLCLYRLELVASAIGHQR